MKDNITVKQYTLLDLIKELKNPRIPYFQREYRWQKKHLDDLIEDIFNSKENTNYYLGTIVIKNDSINEKQWIIDGQQRISTLLLIIKALYSFVKYEKPNYLIELEKHFDEIEFDSYNFSDKGILQNILNDNISDDNSSNYYKNWNLISRKINNWPNEKYQEFIDKIQNVIFSYVNVEADAIDENVLFEKINSSGIPLSQFDLVKNFLLSKIYKINESMNDVDKYSKELEKINEIFFIKLKNKQKDIDNAKSDLIRSFIAYETKELPNKDNIYERFKKIYSYNFFDNPIETFAKLKKFSTYYKYFYLKEYEKNKNFYGPMILISEKFETFITLLINILELNSYINENDEIILNSTQEENILKLLLMIECYIYRRTFLNLPEKTITRKIPCIKLDNNKSISHEENLYHAISPEDDEFKTYRIPSLDEFRKGLIDNNYDIYNKNKKVLKCFLFRLGFNKEEKRYDLEDYQIEHILPQKHNNLYDMEKEKIEEKMHTIGNLTLTNCNQQLNNKTFNEKIVILKERDNFPLNTYFYNLTKWNELEMNKWANHLLNLSNKIWNFDHLEKSKTDVLYTVSNENDDFNFFSNKNYNFWEDKDYERAIKTKSTLKKIKDLISYRTIKKIIEMYVSDGLGYEDIERIIFNESNLRGWLGQTIIEALKIDKAFDKGSIDEKNKLEQYINMKNNDIYLFLEFVKSYVN